MRKKVSLHTGFFFFTLLTTYTPIGIIRTERYPYGYKDAEKKEGNFK